MNNVELVAVAMILAGVLALAYRSSSFTTATHEAALGPLTMSVKEQQTVNAPVWAGIAAIGFGAAMLVFGGKRG